MTLKSFAVALIAMMLFSACVKRTHTTQLEATVHKDDNTVQIACYSAVERREHDRRMAIAGLPKDQQMMVVLLDQQGEFATGMMSMVTGKSTDPCARGTNIYDVEIAEMNAQARETESYLSSGTTLVKWGIGGLTANALFDKVGGDVVTTLTGGSKLNTNSQNSGSFNTAGRDTNNTAGTVINDNSENCDGCDTPEFNSNNNETTAPCPEGQVWDIETKSCIPEVENPVETQDFDLESCLANPPAGWNGATPLWSAGCSCGSHSSGSC